MMVSATEERISSSLTNAKNLTINADEETKNVLSTCKEKKVLEIKADHERRESNSTRTSSSSSVSAKKKINSYYASSNGVYRALMANQIVMLSRSKKNNINSTAQRILSAKFLRVKQLQSELIEAQKRITDLENENRILKTIHKRQDSALRKYESQESYLPHLLKSHEEEMRVLTLKHKKIRGSYNDLETRYNRQFSELTSLRDRYKHLLKISQDKHLLERERLTKQNEEMKILMVDLKNKIQFQTRRVDLEVKNFKYQLSLEFQKQKTQREEIKQLQDTIQQMKNSLEEKDRYIAVCKMSHVLNKTNNPKSNRASITNLSQAMRDPASTVHDNILEDDADNKKVQIPTSSDVIEMKKIKPIHAMPQISTLSTGDIIAPVVVEKSMNQEVEHIVTEKYKNPNNSEAEENISNNSVKADSNNNDKEKLNFLVDIHPLKPLKSKITLQKSSSLESFEGYEKSLQDEESSSDKSDDFRQIDTVSWLEIHEKTNYDIFDASRTERKKNLRTSLLSSNFKE